MISGGGALTKRGSGTLYLNNSNSYSGGTVFDSGTDQHQQRFRAGLGRTDIQWGRHAADHGRDVIIASSVTINAGAIGMFDMMGNTSTISGVIGGAGSLALISSGTLTLTGGQHLHRRTLVTNTGVLNINNVSAIGTSTLILDNGTLQIAAASR